MTARQDRWIGLGVALFAMIPSLVWISQDSRIWPWDQAWYGEVSADLWYLLNHDLLSWLRGMLRLLPQKPPLVSWFGQFLVPVGLAVGNVEAALLLLCVGANVATLFLLWLYARRLAPNGYALPVLAVVSAASMPLFVGMGHEFVTEPLQTLVIVATFVLAAFADRIRLPRLVILLVLLGFAGFGVKTTSPAYTGLALVLIAAVALVRMRKGEALSALSRTDIALAVVTAGLAALTTAWYVVNIDGMLQHVRNALDAGIALNYGSASGLPTKAMYWLKAFDAGSSLVSHAGLAVFAAAAVAVGIQAPRAFRTRNLPGIAAVLALVHSIVVLVQFMFQIIEETRFITSLMPMMVMALVFALAGLRNQWLTKLLVVAASVHLVAVHISAAGRVSIQPSTVWLKPLAMATGQRELARALIDQTCSARTAFQYVIVATEIPSMNANSLAFEAAKARNQTGFRCYYTGLGYAATEMQPVIERMTSLNPVSIIVPSAALIGNSPNYLNVVVAPFARYMHQSNRYRPLASPIGGYIVYKRID
jgi:hypothetical protein